MRVRIICRFVIITIIKPFFIITPWNYWRNYFIYATHLQFGPRTSIWFRQCQVLVFRKMSFPIHLNFSPLACIFFLTHFLMKLHCMDTLKSLLTMIQHMHCLLVFCKMSVPINFNFSLLAGIIVLITIWWNYIAWLR